MVKSVVNQEFVALTSAVYAKAGFVRRKKGSRFPAESLGFNLWSPVSLPVGWQAQLLGTAPGYDQYGLVIQYSLWAVTNPQGRRSASYSRGGTYVLCDNLQYVPV